MHTIQRNRIKNDLLAQLKRSGHFGAYYLDLITHYMELVDLKEELQQDIKNQGIRVDAFDVKGIPIKKPNESVSNLLKVSQQLLKILTDLDLKVPRESDENNDI